MEMNMQTLPDFFESIAPEDTRKVLYIDRQGQEITYAIFYNRVELVTELLKKLGIKKGQTIAIISENLANWACAYFAIARVGAIALPLLPEISDHDLTLFLTVHEVKTVFTSASQMERLTHLDVKSLSVLITMENFALKHLDENRMKIHERLGRELEKFKKAALEFIRQYDEPEPMDVRPDDPFCILYAPDESNRWRPVPLSHRNVISALFSLSESLEFNQNDRIVVFLSLALTLPALLGILLPLLVNAQAVLLPKPENTAQLQADLEHFKPTHLFMDSALAERIFKETRPTLAANESFFKRSLRRLMGMFAKKSRNVISERPAFPNAYHWLICTNFAPLGPRFQRYLVEKNISHHLLFGHFRTASILLSGRADKAFCWVQGKMLPKVKWRIVNMDGEASGELYVNGPMVSLQETAPEKDEEEFLRTEWVAQEKDGIVQILGPLMHRIILPSGEQVFPELIEAVLNEYDWIAESLVYPEDEALFVRVYPDPQKAGTMAREYPERLAIELLRQLKKSLPVAVAIKGLSIESEPFAKNAFGQILRAGSHKQKSFD